MYGVASHCATMMDMLNNIQSAQADRLLMMEHLQEGFKLDNEIAKYCHDPRMVPDMLSGYCEDPCQIPILARSMSEMPTCTAMIEVADHMQFPLTAYMAQKQKVELPEELLIAQAILCNQFRTVRLRLLQVMLQATRKLTELWGLDFTSIQTRLRTISAEMVDETLTTVPTIIPWYDPDSNKAKFDHTTMSGSVLRGHWITWPLGMAICADGVSAERRLQIRNILRFVGSEIGIGVASVFSSEEAAEAYLKTPGSPQGICIA